MDCIFCKIIAGEIPSEKVYESENVIAFKDINPMAPVHILIIPKKHIDGAHKLDKDNVSVVGEIFLAARQLAEEFHLGEGYRIVTNVGDNAGQTVKHLHFHLLGGHKLEMKLG